MRIFSTTLVICALVILAGCAAERAIEVAPPVEVPSGWSIVRQADWTTHFRDVTYADAQHAWTVGDLGVIAATSDGGKSWTSQRSGVTRNLQRVVFVDAKTGWVAGDRGIILHTADGGNTWREQKIGTTADMTAVYFVDTKTGWAAGNSPTLLGSSGIRLCRNSFKPTGSILSAARGLVLK